jgi:hypothetical protein
LKLAKDFFVNFVIGFFSFALVFVHTTLLANAIEEGELYSLRFGGQKHQLNIGELADAKTLLGSEIFQTYKSQLNAMSCEAAGALLNEAFVQKYPALKNVGKMNGTETEGYRKWRFGLVSVKYLDLFFCDAAKSLNSFAGSYRLFPDKFGFYQHREDSRNGRDSYWFVRDIDIESLVSLADRKHVRAIIFMTDLASLGYIFENSGEVEYFLLQRACTLNYRCAEVQGRIGLLEDELPTRRQAELKRDARDLNKPMWANFPGYTKPAK